MKEYKDYAKITAHFDLAIEEAIKFGGDVGKHAVLLFETMRNELDTIPAADVVEVVRCKDCVSSRPINMEYWVKNAFYKECVWCKWFDTGMLPDEYCSYGKRKMDKEE